MPVATCLVQRNEPVSSNDAHISIGIDLGSTEQIGKATPS